MAFQPFLISLPLCFFSDWECPDTHQQKFNPWRELISKRLNLINLFEFPLPVVILLSLSVSWHLHFFPSIYFLSSSYVLASLFSSTPVSKSWACLNLHALHQQEFVLLRFHRVWGFLYKTSLSLKVLDKLSHTPIEDKCTDFMAFSSNYSVEQLKMLLQVFLKNNE